MGLRTFPKAARTDLDLLFFRVSRRDDRLDVSAHVEVTDNGDFPRIQEIDQVLQDDVRYVLVKDVFVAEAVDVEF